MKINILIGANLTELRRALGEAKTQIEATGKVAERAMVPATAAFTGLTVAVGATLKAFGDFERVLNEIRAVSGATTDEMAQMRAVALDLGAKTKFSAKEAAQGMAELSKAGFTAGETIRALPGVLAAAAAGGTSIAQAAELAGGALRGFGLAADQSNRVADVLAQSTNRSAIGFNDLQLSFKYIAPVAASTGQSLEGMASALSILGNSMIRGEQAGTTIRAVLARLVDPPKEAAEALSRLGVSVQDTQGRMRSLEAVVGDLRNATAKMTEAQRTAVLSQVAGTEAMSGLLALVRTSPQDYAAMTAAMEGAQGAASQMADTMNQGLGPAIEQLGGSIETLAIQVGENFAPAAQAAAKVVQGVVDELGKAPKPLMDFATGLTAAGIAASGAAALLGGVGIAVRALAVGLAALSLPLAPALLGIAAIGAAAGIATVAIKNAGEATDSLDAALTKQSGKINALVAEYDRLQGKVGQTTAEQTRMARIIEELTKLSPNLVAGYNAQGQATEINRQAVARLNDELAKQIRLNQQAAQTAAVAARENIAAQRIEMQDAAKRLQALDRRISAARAYAREGNSGMALDQFGKPVPAWQTNSLAELESLRKTTAEQLAGLRSATTEAQRDYDLKRFGTSQSFGPEPGRSDSRGAAVTVPTRAKAASSRRAASSASGFAAVDPSAVNQELERLNQTYERAINLNDRLYEGGVAGEIKLLEQFRDRLKVVEMSPGLSEAAAKQRQQVEDRLAIARKRQGEEAAAQLRSQEEHEANLARTREAAAQRQGALLLERLPLIERERATIEATYSNAIKKAEEQYQAEMRQARAIEAKGAAYQEEARQRKEAAQVALGAAKTIADVERQIDAAEAAKKNTQAFRAFQASLVAVALDPSWERIANFVRDTVSNRDQLERVVEVMKQIAQASKDAGGGVQGFVAGMTKAAQEGDLAGIALAALAKIVDEVAGAWDRAAKAVQAYGNVVADSRVEAMRLRADRLGTPEALRSYIQARNEVADTNRRNELRKLVEAELKPQVRAEWVTEADFQRSVDEETERRFAATYGDLLNERALADKAAIAEREKAYADRGPTGKKYGLVINQEVPKEVQQGLDEYADTLERLIALEDELAKGERNDRGERISIEARLALDLKKLYTEEQKRINNFKREEAAITKQILDLEKDAEQARQDILNEGIAQRQPSEAQYKAARLARLDAETNASRSTLSDRLQELKDARTEEENDYNDAVERLKNLSKERVDSLRQQYDILWAQAERLQLNLGIEQELTKELQRQRDLRASMPSSSSSSSGGSSGSSSSAPAQTAAVSRPTKTYSLVYNQLPGKFHTGGIVPGRGEQSATVLGGEMVLTQTQQADLWRLITRGGGAGYQVGAVNIQITAAPGQDLGRVGAEAGRAAWEALNQRLRRAGPGFRV